MMTIKEMRTATGLSQNKFANILEIPTANISRWEQGGATPPEYVVKLIEKVLRFEGYLE